MVKLHFSYEAAKRLELTEGIKLLEPEYDFRAFEQDGLPAALENTVGETMEISCNGEQAILRFDFSRRNLFFRGLSVLLQHLAAGEKTFTITESTYFTTAGPLLDLSQGNMVLKTETLKEFLRRLSMMGINMCMLYTEDNYTIPGEPYFGYMRGRYSYEEFKELDDYGYALGIEVIPAIQTLAHLEEVLKWNVYKPLRENRRCLLPDEPETYEFIRKMLTAATAPFRTKRIFIGMDEPAYLGFGTHFIRHGYEPAADIQYRHLKTVCQITREMGLEAIVSHDPFGKKAPARRMEDVDDVLQYSFWHYTPRPVEYFEERIKANCKDKDRAMFMTAIWSFLGFGPNWRNTMADLNALRVCRAAGVHQAVESIWMVGFDCDFRVNLLGMQMFAEFCYHENPSSEQIGERFKFCTGGSFAGFYALGELDNLPGCEDNNCSGHCCSASEYLLWQDPMAGMFDYDVDGLPLEEHYEKLAEQFEKFRKKDTRYADIFSLYHLLALCLRDKCQLGNRLRTAYKDGDRKELRRLAEQVIPGLIENIGTLRKTARTLWRSMGKPLGWEVYDIHYGGVLARLESASDAVLSYLEGKIKRLEELEEQRLSFDRGDKCGRLPGYCDKWGRMVSASRVAPEWYLPLPKVKFNEV